MAEINKALEIFGLDKTMFNKMKKSELKLFIQLATQEPLKQVYGQVLLDAKRRLKQVRINDGKTLSNKQTHSGIDCYGPTNASIDVLFNSLVSCNTSNTFVL
jgi:hypothetical protein